MSLLKDRFSFSKLAKIAKKLYISNKKKLTIGALTCSMLFGASTYVHATDLHTDALNTIYHVYVDHKLIGTIEDKELYERLIKNKIAEVNDMYSTFNLVIGEDVELIPERVFRARTNTTETLELLNEKLTVKATATALNVNNEQVLFVEEEEIANNVLRKMKLQYVTEEDLDGVEELKEGLSENKPENQILDVKFSVDVNIEQSLAKPDQILNVDQAVKKLNLGTLEEKVYIVEQGDVLSTIAEKHSLTTSQLLVLNPDIDENTLLQIGKKLNVTAYEPVLTVIVEEEIVSDEEIPFSTETEDDPTMWKGDKKVVQEGKVGKRVVHYSVIRENGKTIKREIIKEEILQEPINRLIKNGTKESPSRGTGSLGWPAVGGYISSYQGMRWGRFHRGIDIARPRNHSILAADNGTVTFAGWRSGYGNTVEINHNNGMETLYAHLNSIDVQVGQTVAKGQKIGVMGQTGNSTGIHLHFEVFQNGKLVNPMDFLSR